MSSIVEFRKSKYVLDVQVPLTICIYFSYEVGVSTIYRQVDTKDPLGVDVAYSKPIDRYSSRYSPAVVQLLDCDTIWSSLT